MKYLGLLLAYNLLCLFIILAYFFFEEKLEPIFILNFEIGFLGFVGIIFSNLFWVKKRIHEQAKNTKNLQRKKKPSKFLLGISISMGGFRILGYLLVCIALYLLLTKKIFDVLGFISGVGASLFAVVMGGIFLLKKSSK